ncbi:hypothetical protein [Halomarina litorea]|uniref:hypothetical protein n=1 Tax=Halomarina litorea TaxID=2961595 RepID=UPI0020C1BAC2|nr:hypothetical protein [Halomarina sp. BCD28]
MNRPWSRRAVLCSGGTGIALLSGCVGRITGSSDQPDSESSGTADGFDGDPYDIIVRNHASTEQTIEVTVRDDHEVVFAKQVTVGPLPQHGGQIFDDVVETRGTYEVEVRFPSGEGEVYNWEVDDDERDVWISITGDSELTIHLTSQD